MSYDRPLGYERRVFRRMSQNNVTLIQIVNLKFLEVLLLKPYLFKASVDRAMIL